MRVAAPRPNIALCLPQRREPLQSLVAGWAFKNSHKPLQRRGIESISNFDPPAVGQLHPQRSETPNCGSFRRRDAVEKFNRKYPILRGLLLCWPQL
jgi:hypothetical protein